MMLEVACETFYVKKNIKLTTARFMYSLIIHSSIKVFENIFSTTTTRFIVQIHDKTLNPDDNEKITTCFKNVHSILINFTSPTTPYLELINLSAFQFNIKNTTFFCVFIFDIISQILFILQNVVIFLEFSLITHIK